MYELKFKNFDFRNFMDFVLNLADYYGLDEVRFSPDKREFFDEVQLCHISPSRNVEDKRGFVWAWMRSEKNVREVSFDQFSKDGHKKINIVINLDYKTVKLNNIIGFSQAVIEDLVEKKFGVGQNLSDIKLEKLQTRVAILEFFIALFFAFCFTSIYAITKILQLTYNWKPLLQYFIMFFGLALMFIYIVLPIIEIIKKVGTGCIDITKEFIIDFKQKNKLGKLKIVIAFILGLIAIYSFFK